MKKALLSIVVIVVLAACNNTTPPKEIASEFIKAVYSGDAVKASDLATANTKSSVNNAKPETPATTADESFSLATLNETVSGNVAEVKNEFIKLSLQKEGEGWKVSSSPELVQSIVNRQNDLTALKNKWEALQKEYESRLQLASEYVDYKKGQGTLSPQMQTLAETIKGLSAKTAWDKEKIQLYVQKQKQLADMIDKSVEPSYTANADMSMKYILQFSQSNSRIKTAQDEYQGLAGKTASNTYPVLSVR